MSSTHFATGSVALCGPRALPTNAHSCVSSVVGSLLSAGRSISVGCAAGADSVVLSAAVAAGSAASVQVFAVGGSCGKGFAGKASAVAGVQAAQAAGASVSWWSGGPRSKPLRSRLVGRSLACIGSAQALVAFTGPPPERWSGHGPWWSSDSGTWSTVAAAVAGGLTVVVIPVIFSERPLPSLPVPGSWVRSGSGVWSHGWRFCRAGLFQ